MPTGIQIFHLTKFTILQSNLWLPSALLDGVLTVVQKTDFRCFIKCTIAKNLYALTPSCKRPMCGDGNPHCWLEISEHSFHCVLSGCCTLAAMLRIDLLSFIWILGLKLFVHGSQIKKCKELSLDPTWIKQDSDMNRISNLEYDLVLWMPSTCTPLLNYFFLWVACPLLCSLLYALLRSFTWPLPCSVPSTVWRGDRKCGQLEGAEPAAEGRGSAAGRAGRARWVSRGSSHVRARA